jgi:hypothetical protein
MKREILMSTHRGPRPVLHTSRAKAAAPAAPRKSAGPPGPTGIQAERVQQIAVAAYYLAEKRNFTPGSELEDWLCAERQIDAAEQAVRGTAEPK